MKTRIYRVAISGTTNHFGQIYERLIRATSQAQATAHAIKGIVVCEIAQPDDMYRLGKSGVEIEDVEPQTSSGE